MGGKSVSDKANSLQRSFPFSSGELLARGLAALGFPAEDGIRVLPEIPKAEKNGDISMCVRGINSIIPLVNRYIKELELFNAVFDLVGAETGSEEGRADLVVRHILDSLAPWKEILATLAGLSARQDVVSNGATVSFEIADAGSGAGFPGIPLAIVFPEIKFTLVERMSKRCAFLENCTAVLGLKNVTILNTEVEKAPANAFDIVVFRAFRPLDQAMIRTLLRLPRAGGKLAAWKARREKIEEEMMAIAGDVHGYTVLPLAVPFLDHEERHLVLIN